MSYEQKNKTVNEHHLIQTKFIQDYTFGERYETHAHATKQVNSHSL